MSAPPPIDQLMAIAARCAMRCAPLPKDLIAELSSAHAEIEAANSEAERALCSAAYTVLAHPDRAEALALLSAAHDLVAALRKRPDAGPTRWDQKAGLIG